MANYGITELADRYGCLPELISKLLYRRRIDPTKCVVKSGRRLIPEALLPQLEAELRKAGYAIPVVNERRDQSAIGDAETATL